MPFVLEGCFMQKITCTVCPKGCLITAINGELSGYQCERGLEYAKSETVNPVRNISSTVKIAGGRYSRVPVKTDKPIDKKNILNAAEQLNNVELTSPVKIGDIALANVLGSGVNFVVTRNL